MKKNVLCGLLAFLSLLALTACGNAAPEASSDEPQYVDDAFIESLSSGLEARFDAADKLENEKDELDDEEYGKRLSGVIDIEINELSTYKSGLFEDSKLQENAIAYLNALEECKAPLSNFGTDPYGVIEEYNKAYDTRIKLLATFISDYGLTVAEKHQASLDDLLSRAQEVIRNEEKTAEVEALLSSLTFEEVENSYGWRTYRALLDNATAYDIDYVNYTIDLLDESGVVIEQTFANANAITSGKKINIEFSTDKTFSKYELTFSYEFA